MKFFPIALFLCVLGVSCERHDFEETKQLHEHGGHDAGHAAAGHGDEHGAEKKKDDHGH